MLLRDYMMLAGVQLNPKQLTVWILNSGVAGNGICLIPAYRQMWACISEALPFDKLRMSGIFVAAYPGLRGT
jgi:hypothetical protein